ncbi:NAD-P-binding protein [Stereum hirsutum FP-91666 SS1]|uniref:NAD-P-binding protein n=1 Tax=Stereum hirsutum (strain FP-91666) TaxID=721885 RepID=UPI000440A4BB|nr:NAD-P-binding protein [Stereum hirsutum FP-91666 SS1]EIM90150.1 NAD-P-binding protein [Stereum hirsutum FP-91666 SS1]
MGLINFIYRSVRSSSIDLCLHGTPDLPSSKPYALVTGSTAGVGHAFAQELASRGFNLLLHGRNPISLASVQSSLQYEHPDLDIRTLCYDAADPNVEANIEALVHEITSNNIPLTVLVNNVGYQSKWTPFAHQKPSEMLDVLRVQTEFPTLLTSRLLPLLAQNEPSAMLNIGGLTSQYPASLLAVHSGAKSYFVDFTEALATEMKQFEMWLPEEQTRWLEATSPLNPSLRNAPSSPSTRRTAPVVMIHAINLHSVSSSSNLSAPSFFTPTGRVMAKAALEVVGCGEVFVTAYWRHALMGAVLAMMPRSVVVSLMGKEIARLRKLDEENKAKKKDT